MVLYPLHPATKARPIPVFPAVPSTIIPGYPGTNFPYSSAYFISHKAALSLTLPPGFINSALPYILHLVNSLALFSLIKGVLPIASSKLSNTLSAIIFL